MESELRDFTSKVSVVAPDDGSIKDVNRPLLKPESNDVSIDELHKKCAAYARNDVYGTMGLGPFTIKEKVLLPLAMVTLLPLRVILGVTLLAIYYLICRVCTLFSSPNRGADEDSGREEQESYAHIIGWRRVVIVRCGRFLSRMMFVVFGFYWIQETYRDLSADDNKNSSTENDSRNQREELGRPGVVISNHVSYLDILYHMSSSFPSFVAKESVANLPLVGLISKCLGCVFVQRESKSADFKGVSAVVTERIRQAHQDKSAPTMMLFPEGTTTNGDYLLPFKTGAFLAGAPVLPLILRYPYQRFSPAWDTISGFRHVIFLLCQFVNYIEVKRLPIYYPSQQEKADPKLYASNVRSLMAKEGNLILTDIGLSEKRIYHTALNGKYSLPSVIHSKED